MMTIVPHKGVGPIRFGMSPGEVAKALARSPSSREKRHETDPFETDYFDLMAVYYDSNGACCAVEFHEGGDDVIYDGYDLFGHPASEARTWARLKASGLDDDEYGFVSKALGLAMYAPIIDSPDLDDDEKLEPAEGFMVFRPGYYEEEKERLKGRSLSTDN